MGRGVFRSCIIINGNAQIHQDTLIVIAEYMQFIIERQEKRISMTNQLIEYMKVHLISLNQDLDPLDKSDNELNYIKGQIEATEHLMSVAEDIMVS